jgi:hypothetical protein
MTANEFEHLLAMRTVATTKDYHRCYLTAYL